MADDRRRRPKTVRGGHGRFARPPTPIPDHVDPEETPPPQDVSEAIARLWENRHDAAAIRELRDGLNGYLQTQARHDMAINEWLAPFARSLPAEIANLEASLAKTDAALATAVKAMNDWSDSIRDDLRAQAERITLSEDRLTEHRQMLDSLHSYRLPERVGALEKRNIEQDAGDKRELALSRRRRRLFTTIWTVLSAAGGAVAGWLTK